MSNAEVIGFNITVDEVSVVNVFNSGNHLVNEHENSLEGELTKSLIEQ